MRWILRALFVNSLSLYLAILIFQGLAYDGQFSTLVYSGVVLTLLERIVKPVIKLLLLPINLLTLGLFGWVTHVLTLFILNQAVAGFEVRAFYFAGINYQGFVIPAMDVSLLAAYVLGSIAISLVTSFLIWLLK